MSPDLMNRRHFLTALALLGLPRQALARPRPVMMRVVVGREVFLLERDSGYYLPSMGGTEVPS